jgi:hypothetical protein
MHVRHSRIWIHSHHGDISGDMSSDSVIKSKAASAASVFVGAGKPTHAANAAASPPITKRPSPSPPADTLIKSSSSPALDGSLDGSEDSLSGSESQQHSLQLPHSNPTYVLGLSFTFFV